MWKPITYIIVLCAVLLPIERALAQPTIRNYVNGTGVDASAANVTATGSSTVKVLGDWLQGAPSGGGVFQARGLPTTNFWANNYGSCTWGTATGNDVGPCINSAIAAAAAAGGGTVEVPAGQFNFATQIVNNNNGVHIEGAGVGIARDNIVPGNFIAATRLIWSGASGAGPGLDIEPANGASTYLYSADLVGIAIDCQDLLDTCVQIKQTSASLFRFGQAEARKTGILFTTNNIDTSGTQQNDIWLWVRNVSLSYNASGVVFDSGAGSSFNTSYNPNIHSIFVSYAGGDGVVVGNADTNVFGMIWAYRYGTATTGSPFVCANSAYVPPSGVPTNGQCYGNTFTLMGAPAQFGGFTQGSTLTQAGGNVGSATLNAVTLSTNAATTNGSSVLNFAATTGVSIGESVTCGGTTSGVYPFTQVQSLTSTTVTMRNASVIGGGINGVSSGLSCTFSYGMTSQAASGTYTITATSASTFSVTAPSGGHTQPSVPYAAGVLSATDFTLPLTGTPTTGDTWTLVVPAPSVQNRVIKIDKANSVADAHFEPGATGNSPVGNNAIPNLYGTGGIAFASDPGNYVNVPTSATGLASVAIGGSGNLASGTSSIALGGAGNVSSNFFTGTLGGQNNIASGIGATTIGQNNTASGTDGFTAGQFAIDRGRYTTDCWSAGRFAATGDAQTCVGVLRATGASASAIRLTADQAAAGSANCVNIANNTAYLLTLDIMAFDHTTVTKNAVWPTWTGLLMRGANAASTAVSMNTTPTPLINGTLTGQAIAITADTTNGCLNISYTPPTGNTDTFNVVTRVTTVEAQ